MKPCTSYVQTLFTRQESNHWLLQMAELGRSLQSTSIYSLLQFLLVIVITHNQNADNQKFERQMDKPRSLSFMNTWADHCVRVFFSFVP